MKTAVVVGGGIAGILSALLLKRDFDQVYLIEKQERIGGLLNSVQNEQGLWFDYGTHFLRDTGIQELDSILYRDVSEADWHILDYLKAGNFFRSRLNESSHFPDIRLFPKRLYQKGIKELLDINEEAKEQSFHTLEEQLRAIYGNTLTKIFYGPVLRKFYRTELNELSPNAHMLFGLSRFLAFDPSVVAELKKSPLLDQKLAAHHFSEKQSGLKNYYPKEGGIGRWIDQLKKRLDACGVSILTSQSVTHIEHHDQRVESVTLENDQQLSCDLLTWTIPVMPFLKLSGTKLNQPVSPPRRLLTRIFHFAFDKPFLSDLYYVSCYDPKVKTYRVTLYPNIPSPAQRTSYHLTAEVLLEANTNDISSAEVRHELDIMGIVSRDSKVLYQREENISEGFPILTPKFMEDSTLVLEKAQKEFQNVFFLGKNAGTAFFMNDVLINVYRTIVEKMEVRSYIDNKSDQESIVR